MPKRFCMTCGALFDREETGTQRCPPCQQAATKRKNTDPPGRPSASQRGYGAQWRRLSERLIAAATGCALCGGEFTRDDPATVDHIVPKARGGTSDESNLRVIHRSENSRRGGQMPKRSRAGR